MRSWKDVYSYWQTFEVHQIEVQDYNSKLHDALPWSHRRKRLAVYLNENPKNDTAKHLTMGKVKASDEIYAAFALYATLRQFPYYNKARVVQLEEVTRNALFQFDRRQGDYWANHAKNVLPSIDTNQNLFNQLNQKGLAWNEYICLSAQLWKQLADEWLVLKFPPDWG